LAKKATVESSRFARVNTRANGGGNRGAHVLCAHRHPQGGGSELSDYRVGAPDDTARRPRGVDGSLCSPCCG
jgi:hypothetical protein